MSDVNEYSVAEEKIQEKLAANNRRIRNRGDRLKAERAKERIVVPKKKETFDLKRVKKLSDLPEE